MSAQPFKDYYNILGVPPDATPADFKAAFRIIAREFHPDANRDKSETERTELAEKFKAVSEAADVLRNPEKRAAYDMEWRAHQATEDTEGTAQPAKGKPQSRETSVPKDPAVPREQEPIYGDPFAEFDRMAESVATMWAESKPQTNQAWDAAMASRRQEAEARKEQEKITVAKEEKAQQEFQDSVRTTELTLPQNHILVIQGMVQLIQNRGQRDVEIVDAEGNRTAAVHKQAGFPVSFDVESDMYAMGDSETQRHLRNLGVVARAVATSNVYKDAPKALAEINAYVDSRGDAYAERGESLITTRLRDIPYHFEEGRVRELKPESLEGTPYFNK